MNAWDRWTDRTAGVVLLLMMVWALAVGTVALLALVGVVDMPTSTTTVTIELPPDRP
ncbi:MAG: hypothetical protein AAGA90_21755 [Actinomycetota bacterium]